MKNALIKDGWVITDDPFTIEYQGIKVFADLAAERPIAAMMGERRIVVEIKSFLGRSPIHDLEIALGQYVLYRTFLKAIAPQYGLYLAVSAQVYQELVFQRGHQADRRPRKTPYFGRRHP